MVFVRFLCETQPNRCRVFCRVSIGYYGLSLSVGLLHAVARASSYGLKTLKKLSGVSLRAVEPTSQAAGTRPGQLGGSKQLLVACAIIWGTPDRLGLLGIPEDLSTINSGTQREREQR